MFNKHDISRNQCQLFWHQAEKGYDWWWHSFTGHHAENIGCEYGEYDR